LILRLVDALFRREFRRTEQQFAFFLGRVVSAEQNQAVDPVQAELIQAFAFVVCSVQQHPVKPKSFTVTAGDPEFGGFGEEILIRLVDEVARCHAANQIDFELRRKRGHRDSIDLVEREQAREARHCLTVLDTREVGLGDPFGVADGHLFNGIERQLLPLAQHPQVAAKAFAVDSGARFAHFWLLRRGPIRPTASPNE